MFFVILQDLFIASINSEKLTFIEVVAYGRIGWNSKT